MRSKLQHVHILKVTTSACSSSQNYNFNTFELHVDFERLMDKFLHQFTQPPFTPTHNIDCCSCFYFVAAYALKSFSILCVGVCKGLQIKLVQDFVHQLSAENTSLETNGEDAFWYAQVHLFHKPRFQFSDPGTKTSRARAYKHARSHTTCRVAARPREALQASFLRAPTEKTLPQHDRPTTAPRPPHDRPTTASRPPLGNKAFC